MKLESEFLGNVVNGKDTIWTRESVELIQRWEAPWSVKEAQQFLGMANYHCQYIKGFAGLAAPLHELTQKQKKRFSKVPFRWEALKDALASLAVLALPNSRDMFILEMDSKVLVSVWVVVAGITR